MQVLQQTVLPLGSVAANCSTVDISTSMRNEWKFGSPTCDGYGFVFQLQCHTCLLYTVAAQTMFVCICFSTAAASLATVARWWLTCCVAGLDAQASGFNVHAARMQRRRDG
jgi:hypothetical protein